MLILGIDPGTATTGFGVIRTTPKDQEVVEFGLIETDKDGKPGLRLIDIHKQVTKLIRRVKPDVIAIEKLFFSTNAKTAMSVGQAIGVIMFTVATEKIEIFEYAPGTIKKQIAGDGRADKKMVQKAVRAILGAKVRSRVHGKTHFDNSADGLAVALCHAYTIGKV
jgi:crossover junction endodeoxyribonuclease RuvC